MMELKGSGWGTAWRELPGALQVAGLAWGWAGQEERVARGSGRLEVAGLDSGDEVA
jgi:hypothetical protein